MIFAGADVFYYDLKKINLNRGGPYIDSPEWLENKKATINPKSNDNRCFQYALTASLNHEQIKRICKEYHKLRLLLISIIEKKYIFHHIKIGKTGKRLN